MCPTTLPSSAYNYRIKFEYDGVSYTTDLSSFYKDLIVLPNGTLLAVEGWKEMMPPQVVSLKVIGHNLDKSDPNLIATSFNATLANKA